MLQKRCDFELLSRRTSDIRTALMDKISFSLAHQSQYLRTSCAPPCQYQIKWKYDGFAKSTYPCCSWPTRATLRTKQGLDMRPTRNTRATLRTKEGLDMRPTRNSLDATDRLKDPYPNPKLDVLNGINNGLLKGLIIFIHMNYLGWANVFFEAHKLVGSIWFSQFYDSKLHTMNLVFIINQSRVRWCVSSNYFNLMTEQN